MQVLDWTRCGGVDPLPLLYPLIWTKSDPNMSLLQLVYDSPVFLDNVLFYKEFLVTLHLKQ